MNKERNSKDVNKLINYATLALSIGQGQLNQFSLAKVTNGSALSKSLKLQVKLNEYRKSLLHCYIIFQI